MQILCPQIFETEIMLLGPTDGLKYLAYQERMFQQQTTARQKSVHKWQSLSNDTQHKNQNFHTILQEYDARNFLFIPIEEHFSKPCQVQIKFLWKNDKNCLAWAKCK